MKPFYFSVVNVFLIFYGAVACGSDFEDTWFGYQKFLTTKPQSEWYFQCGFEATDDYKYMVVDDFKLVKDGSNILVFRIGEGDEWELLEANIGASSITWVEKSDVTASMIEQSSKLYDIFISPSFLDFDQRKGRGLAYIFEDFFEITNTIETKTTIRLNAGFMNYRFGNTFEKLTVYAKDNTLPDRRNSHWTTSTEFEIVPGTRLQCRSLKPF